jgi:hypothetical protein
MQVARNAPRSNQKKKPWLIGVGGSHLAKEAITTSTEP